MRELYGKVLVTQNGERRKVARIEVAARQLANKAAGGDLAAMRLIAQLCPNVKEEVAPGQQKHILLRGGSRSGKTFVLVRALVLRALRACRSLGPSGAGTMGKARSDRLSRVPGRPDRRRTELRWRHGRERAAGPNAAYRPRAETGQACAASAASLS